MLLAVLLIMVSFSAESQADKKILNWYNGGKFGMDTDRAYAKLLKGKKSEPVIVAVIDSGVDVEHEDLQGSIWVNNDEIPGNGIDDDENGYVDDVNGWNFLGNANGDNVHAAQLEVTRLFLQYDKKFKGKTESDITDEQEDFEKYEHYREAVLAGRRRATSYAEPFGEMLVKVKEACEKVEARLGTKYRLKDLEAIKDDPEIGEYAQYIYPIVQKQPGFRFEDFNARYGSTFDHYQNQLNAHYNLELNERLIIGDDPSNFDDRFYGNNDVEGPEASHGTHVAGIIAAKRGNGIGNDGVADNVLIMAIRAVPNGDERDKDVALAIRYAVDNGAQIINGSFIKDYSPYQTEVIKAIRYAEEKGVLICHAAGNSAKNLSKEDNFPSPKYPSMDKEFSNWIEVGASTRIGKHKINEKKRTKNRAGLAARFSNYSKEMVDVFAPGVEIYSSIPDNQYESMQGTSMASPMVAGVAALLKSYYPDLSMLEIREIIFASVQKTDLITLLPGTVQEVPFADLSETGGIVNVYNAVLLAEMKMAKK